MKNAAIALQKMAAFFFKFPAMKNSIMFFAFFALLTNCNLSCDPKDCWRTYEFTIPFSITPALDTFQIGDTLWLQSLIPNNITDNATGELVPVNDFDFKVRSYINRMDTAIQIMGNTASPYAVNDFVYFNEKGIFETINLSSVSFIKIHYTSEESSQKLKIGIVPQKRGLFQIAFANLTDDATKVNLTNSDCFENLKMSYKMNDNMDDNNFHLLQDSPAPIGTLDAFQQSAGYAFFVK